LYMRQALSVQHRHDCGYTIPIGNVLRTCE
jgi:hypothetical protein